ncbi:uncharacterized protein PAE49_006967 [Odontesthes bonariensis]|uniref:uncharacterized protein LOC142382709 n=1 Tax=Odontesthes bonariensis TaxID=219752 RepID=UPI003F5843ED
MELECRPPRSQQGGNLLDQSLMSSLDGFQECGNFTACVIKEEKDLDNLLAHIENQKTDDWLLSASEMSHSYSLKLLVMTDKEKSTNDRVHQEYSMDPEYSVIVSEECLYNASCVPEVDSNTVVKVFGSVSEDGQTVSGLSGSSLANLILKSRLEAAAVFSLDGNTTTEFHRNFIRVFMLRGLKAALETNLENQQIYQVMDQSDSVSSYRIPQRAADHSTQYDHQQIIMLQDDEVVRKAATYLYEKHPAVSSVYVLDNNQRPKLIDGKSGPLSENSRLVLVGHGAGDASGEMRLSGYRAQDVARIIQSTSRVSNKIKSTRVVACEVGSDEGFIESVLKELHGAGVETELHLWNTVVQVTEKGQIITEEVSGDGLQWRHKDSSKKVVATIDRNGAVTRRHESGSKGEIIFTKERNILMPPKKKPGAGRQPAGAGRQPAGAGRQPAGAGRQPAGAGRQPDGAGRQPAGAGRQPDGAGRQPAGGGRQPDGAGRQPDGAGRQPDGAGRQPAGAGRQPAGARRQPAGAGRQPAGAGRQPAGAGRQPDGAGRQPAGAVRPPDAPKTFIDPQVYNELDQNRFGSVEEIKEAFKELEGLTWGMFHSEGRPQRMEANNLQNIGNNFVILKKQGDSASQITEEQDLRQVLQNCYEINSGIQTRAIIRHYGNFGEGEPTYMLVSDWIFYVEPVSLYVFVVGKRLDNNERENKDRIKNLVNLISSLNKKGKESYNNIRSNLDTKARKSYPNFVTSIFSGQHRATDLNTDLYQSCYFSASVIAESARNFRTFPLTLMVLNMAEKYEEGAWKILFEKHPMAGGSSWIDESKRGFSGSAAPYNSNLKEVIEKELYIFQKWKASDPEEPVQNRMAELIVNYNIFPRNNPFITDYNNFILQIQQQNRNTPPGSPGSPRKPSTSGAARKPREA